MDDSLLMCVLNTFTDLFEKLEPFLDIQLLFIAIFSDGHALYKIDIPQKLFNSRYTVKAG